MQPLKFGRTLGIGVRVASNILRDRAWQMAQEKPPAPPSRPSVSAASPELRRRAEQTARAAGQIPKKARAVGHGAKKFGQAFWGPLVHAGSVLWLEISGLFFALFGLFFAQSAYRARGAWMRGTEHEHFLLYVALTLIFFWFSSSSFVRAHKKEKKSRS